jgi:hypothetical protein
LLAIRTCSRVTRRRTGVSTASAMCSGTIFLSLSAQATLRLVSHNCLAVQERAERCLHKI